MHIQISNISYFSELNSTYSEISKQRITKLLGKLKLSHNQVTMQFVGYSWPRRGLVLFQNFALKFQIGVSHSIFGGRNSEKIWWSKWCLRSLLRSSYYERWVQLTKITTSKNIKKLKSKKWNINLSFFRALRLLLFISRRLSSLK